MTGSNGTVRKKNRPTGIYSKTIFGKGEVQMRFAFLFPGTMGNKNKMKSRNKKSGLLLVFESELLF